MHENSYDKLLEKKKNQAAFLHTFQCLFFVLRPHKSSFQLFYALRIKIWSAAAERANDEAVSNAARKVSQ